MFVFKLLFLYHYLILFGINSTEINIEEQKLLFNKLNINEKERLLQSLVENEKSAENILNKIDRAANSDADVQNVEENEQLDDDAKVRIEREDDELDEDDDADQESTDDSSSTPIYNERKRPKKNDDLIINTANGKIRGKAFYTDHHIPRNTNRRNYPFGRKKYRVNAWLGIPFAEKPINNLRFKRPIPIKNWDGILNCTELPNSCYQVQDTVIGPNFEGVELWNPNTPVSEDCLYLNVWAPHPMPKNSPVMVWIYGGGFATGTSTLNIYDPRIIVSETQLIYVSIQYRLSIFGFFVYGS